MSAARFEIVHIDYPIDGDEPYWFVRDSENYRPHNTRHGTREGAEREIAFALEGVRVAEESNQ